jgi:hypothetical protein
MKKTRFIVIALVSMLALGGATMAVGAKGKKTYKSTVSAKFVPGSSNDPYDPFANAKFKGKVGSSKAACKKKRKVVAKSKNTGEKIGSATTSKKGKFQIDASGVDNGKYKITAKKKKKGKKVCKAASATVQVK